ncbi:MAG: macro domain-containing protein [Sulfurimonas sp.]|nr:macro domain-containing protein [Sulfurimonas sp.]
MIIEKTGNIFTTKCQTIVNTVNCVGVMGAGIAFEFKLREENMFKKYKELCDKNQLDIGILWIYKLENKNILNFPTKYDWKLPSKQEYLERGLQKFVDTYKQKGITSIAFPLLGADRGGLNPKLSFSLMQKYLSRCDIEIEIWHFDPEAKDDLYEEFKSVFKNIDDETIKNESKIRIDKVKKIRESLNNPQINSLSGLLRVKGVGEKSLENLFKYIKNYKKSNINLLDYMEA